MAEDPERTPGEWTAARMVTLDGRPLRGKEAAEYVARCIEKGEERGFYAVVGARADGEEVDICHTGNGPDSPKNARFIATMAAKLAESEAALSVAAKGIDGLRDMLKASEAARLKAEQERDEAQRAKYGTPCRCDPWITACGLAEDQRDAAEARLRAVIEAAEGLERRYEDRAVIVHNSHASYVPRADCMHEECVYMRQALDVYRSRVRDAQPPASPEPEASQRVDHPFHSGIDDTATRCFRCGLPWSQHGGHDEK